jgi:hypothetical protein
MEAQALGLLIVLVTGAFSFFIGRKLSARWRARRDAKRRAEREAADSRQVRRARERRGKR